MELLLRRLAEVDSADGRVHGVDVSETMIPAAGRRFRREVAAGRLRLQLAPMEDLPIPAASVDAAITLNTIYFVPDLPAAFTELRRVLHGDGQLVVGLGDPQAMERMAVTRQGFCVRPVDEVIDALRAGGLVVTDHRRVGAGDGAFHLLLATPAPPGES